MEQLDKFREIFEKSPIGIIFFDKKGDLTDANQSALEIIGYPSLNDIIGLNIFNNPYIAPKKDELLEKEHIKIQSPIDFNKIKKANIYNPKHSGIIFIDLTISIIDTGFLVQIQDITERKRAEEALRESEEKFAKVFHANPGAIAILKPEGPIIEVNDEFINLTGYNKDEIIGHSSIDLNLVSQEFREKLYKKMQEKGPCHNLELEIQIKSGEKRAVLNTIEKIEINGEKRIISIFYDINKHKKAKEELKNERELLQVIIDTIPVMITIYDPNELKFQVNKELERVTSWTNEDAQNIDLMAAVYPDLEYREMVTEYVKSLAPGFKDLKMVAKDGSIVETSWANVKIPDGRQVGIGLDIRKRKQLEKELKQARDNLEEEVKERTIELKKAYQILKENEMRYHSLYENAPVGIFHSTVEGKYIDVNPELARILGYDSPEDLISTVNKNSIHDIIYANKELRPNFLESASKAKDWFRTENLYRRKDGNIIIGNLYFRNIGTDKKGNQLLEGFMTDITARKEAEKSLELIIAYNKSLIETSLDPLVTIGPDGKITDVNSATEIATGYSRDELIGTYFSDYFTEPQKAREGYEQVFREGEVRNYELEIRHKKGHLTPVLYNASVYKDKFGKVIGVFAAARDITGIKKAEMQLKEIISELERSNKELQSFAYITSHDLQEPLRTIASYAQLIKKRYEAQLDDDADDFLDFMVKGATRMKEQIQGLLDYSRVGTQGREFKEFNSEEALKETLSNLSSSIEEYDAKITFDQLPIICGDENQIKRVFQNLISNALKFRKEGIQPKIHISAKEGDNEYIFSVSDNGIGLEEQYSNKIFEVFKRLHAIGEYQGAGIGLAIVKKIIDRHSGQIWVESELGKGSTFYFIIPILKSD